MNSFSIVSDANISFVFSSTVSSPPALLSPPAKFAVKKLCPSYSFGSNSLNDCIDAVSELTPDLELKESELFPTENDFVVAENKVLSPTL